MQPMTQGLTIVDPERLRRDEVRVRRRHPGLVPVVAEDDAQPSRGERLPAVRALGHHEQRGAVGVGAFGEQVGLYQAGHLGVDRHTPLAAKAVLMAALAYFVLPGDLVPDLIPALGFTDDAAVIYAALRAVGSQITGEHREKARAALASLAKA